MKVYRGPRTSKWWNKTDAKSLRYWASGWNPGKVVAVDGTIDKTGRRHTKLGIEIERHDIVALHKALFQYQSRMLAQLEKDNAELSATVSQLEKALKKIKDIAKYRHKDAPNLEAFAEAIVTIADHFAWSFYRNKPLKLKLRWLKWKAL